MQYWALHILFWKSTSDFDLRRDLQNMCIALEMEWSRPRKNLREIMKKWMLSQFFRIMTAVTFTSIFNLCKHLGEKQTQQNEW